MEQLQRRSGEVVELKSYCIQDVATEKDIYYRLQRFPIPESERLFISSTSRSTTVEFL